MASFGDHLGADGADRRLNSPIAHQLSPVSCCQRLLPFMGLGMGRHRRLAPNQGDMQQRWARHCLLCVTSPPWRVSLLLPCIPRSMQTITGSMKKAMEGEVNPSRTGHFDGITHASTEYMIPVTFWYDGDVSRSSGTEEGSLTCRFSMMEYGYSNRVCLVCLDHY